jgi:hypothetical protein
MARHRVLLSLSGVGALGCATNLISVLPADAASHAHALAPLEVVARAPATFDPLSLPGSRVAYDNLESALARAVRSGATEWSAAHAATKPRTFELAVELVHAEIEYARARLGVALVVRATLRRREGNEFLAQTQAVCRASALVPPERGGEVVYRCMEQLGGDLGGWLDGVSP